MTTCMYCGGQTPDGSKFCELCGAALPVEVPPEQMFTSEAASVPANGGSGGSYWQNGTAQQPYQEAQQPYGQPGQQPYGQQQPFGQQAQQPPATVVPYADSGSQAGADTGSIGWGILGFIIPIVGIVLFFVWNNTKPKSARMAILGAAISIALSLILYLPDMLM